jgi:hypothetical protein
MWPGATGGASSMTNGRPAEADEDQKMKGMVPITIVCCHFMLGDEGLVSDHRYKQDHDAVNWRRKK